MILHYASTGKVWPILMILAWYNQKVASTLEHDSSTLSVINNEDVATTGRFLRGPHGDETASFSDRRLAVDTIGTCASGGSFLSIPFFGSAYYSCSAFLDKSEAKLGLCGNPNLALDAQPNNDPICQARSGIGSDCHVAFSEPGEWLEYTFNINEESHTDQAVFNVILRVAAKTRRTIRVTIDNDSDTIQKDIVFQGSGFSTFQDVIWEQVRIPGRGLHRITVEFVDGLTNFCAIRVEETSLDLEKELVIPFHADAQKYISFYERTPYGDRLGTCGPGPVDSQPTKDAICNERGSQCNVGWTEDGDELIYLIRNPSNTSTNHDVTLRLASPRKGRRVMIHIEGYEESYMFSAPGEGFQQFQDVTATNVSFPPGFSRLIITFVNFGINFCALSVQ